MDLEQLYYLGELVGVAAIIGSLLFIGLQMRQNTLATRAASHHATTDNLNQVNLAIAQNPELAKVWSIGLDDRKSLNDQERWQLDMVLLCYMHISDTMFYQVKVGAGDPGLLQSEEAGAAFLLNRPGAKDWWSENLFGFSPDFRAYIDGLIDKPSQGAN